MRDKWMLSEYKMGNRIQGRYYHPSHVLKQEISAPILNVKVAMIYRKGAVYQATVENFMSIRGVYSSYLLLRASKARQGRSN